MEDRLQNKAINLENGPALILAGPGSGKTSVLTHHIKHLTDIGINPSEILVITFTKAAALEMQGRFKKIVSSSAHQVVFGTFHSVFYRMLKIFNENTPEIISSEYRKELIEKSISRIDDADTVSNRISLYKSLAHKEKFMIVSSYDSDKEKEDFLKCLEDYNYLLKQDNLMDFDDILERFLIMLKENNYALKTIRSKFKYCLIDEFQDINEIQYEAIKIMFSENKNIFAVGDEDQSIYGFRGATPGIMKRFIEDFENVTVIELTKNYRSLPGILRASETVISGNKGRLKQQKQECVKAEENQSFYLYVDKNTSLSEDKLYINLKAELDKGKACAVLVRTNKAVLEYKNKLIYEGKDKKRIIIRNDIIHIFSSYINFSLDASINNFKCILNVPNRQIPNTILNERDKSLEEVLRRHLGTYKGQALSVLNKQLNILKKLTPYSYFIYLRNIVGVENYLNEKYSQDKKTVLEELNNVTEQSLKALSLSEVLNLLMDLKLKPINEKTFNYKNLYISTFHQSKGLEYDCVFLPDVTEGNIPTGLSVTDCNIEEERRLFYVAMTRAKEKLFIYTIKNEESGGALPSRFLAEF